MLKGIVFPAEKFTPLVSSVGLPWSDSIHYKGQATELFIKEMLKCYQAGVAITILENLIDSENIMNDHCYDGDECGEISQQGQ